MTLRRVLPLLAALAVLSAACGSGGGDGAAPEPDVVKRPTEPENVAFYYQRIRSDTDLGKLGKSSMIVTVPPREDEQVAIQAIHDVGADAYRYVQVFWFPEGREYEGIDIAANLDWAYCREGKEPLVGRTVKRKVGDEDWYFIDANEREVLEQARAYFSGLKSLGWDGIMFDRGYAALTGQEESVMDIWYRSSTCTDDPVEKGRTFADAYLGVLQAAKDAGLKVLLNYGRSAFDPVLPMRPDPSSPQCQRREFPCPTLDDVWPMTDFALDEAIAHPEDQMWAHDFAANEANEKMRAEGKVVVGLITEGTLGGAGTFTRDNVYFQWARVKLFKIPLAVGTGDDGCPNAPEGSICNRHGAFPELTEALLGEPVSAAPMSTLCDAGSTERCVWSRPYEWGMVTVNVSPTAKATGPLKLGLDGCRYLKDVYSGQPLAGNQCVSAVELELPPWSGRPVLYGTEPW